MALTSSQEVVVAVLVTAIIVILVALYMFNRYMKRRGPELATHEAKSVLDDRAFNQIRIGQAAADRLSRTGVDVSSAKSLLARAEASRLGGNYDQAIDLAKKAQDSLAAARSGASPLTGATPAARWSPGPTASPSASSPLLGSAAPAVSGASMGFTAPPTTPFVAAEGGALPETGAVGDGVPNRPPKNKMEAHFQLELAQEELDGARNEKSRTKPFRDAEGFLKDGQVAYEKQDFTEALRLALKSRRTLGTRIEALPVSSVAATPTAASVAAGRDPANLTEGPTFGTKCPQCGRMAAPADQFCRGCGGPIPPALCRNCGAPLLAGDRFCGKCGATQT